MVGVQELRRLALGLPEAAEQDHHGFPSFRVRGKIFATLPDDEHLNVMLDADGIEQAVRADPACTEALRWGKRLAAVRITLALADVQVVAELLWDAWQRKAPVRLASEHRVQR